MPNRIATLFRVYIPYAKGQFEQIADRFDRAGIRVLVLSWVTCYDQNEPYRALNFVTSDPDQTQQELNALGYEYSIMPLYPAPLLEDAGDLYSFALRLSESNQLLVAQLSIPADFANHYLAIGFHPDCMAEGLERLRDWSLRSSDIEEVLILSFSVPPSPGEVARVLEPIGTYMPDLLIRSLTIAECYSERRLLMVLDKSNQDEVTAIYQNSGLAYYEFDAYAMMIKREGGTHFIRSLAEMIGSLLIERMMTFPRNRLVALSAYGVVQL